MRAVTDTMNLTRADDYVVSSHAQSRWNERRPDKNIRSSLKSAQRNSYHPIAVRAIANYGGMRDNRYCLVADTGEVFVIEHSNGRQTVVTVLVSEKTLYVCQTDKFESLTEDELVRAMKSIEIRQNDIKSMVKQLAASRSAVERRLAVVKKQNKRRSRQLSFASTVRPNQEKTQ